MQFNNSTNRYAANMLARAKVSVPVTGADSRTPADALWQSEPSGQCEQLPSGCPFGHGLSVCFSHPLE